MACRCRRFKRVDTYLGRYFAIDAGTDSPSDKVGHQVGNPMTCQAELVPPVSAITDRRNL
jgi:hypothetical protein